MHLKVEDNESYKYDVIDVNTGKKIPRVQEADDETGEFTLFLIDSNTNELIIDKEKDEVVLFKFKGNIKLVKKGE
jgi:hypothetical protein